MVAHLKLILDSCLRVCTLCHIFSLLVKAPNRVIRTPTLFNMTDRTELQWIYEARRVACTLFTTIVILLYYQTQLLLQLQLPPAIITCATGSSGIKLAVNCWWQVWGQHICCFTLVKTITYSILYKKLIWIVCK